MLGPSKSSNRAGSEQFRKMCWADYEQVDMLLGAAQKKVLRWFGEAWEKEKDKGIMEGSFLVLIGSMLLANMKYVEMTFQSDR